MEELSTQFGRIDIYLFDQLLRGNIRPGARVLDVGCGSGRNLVYLMRSGYEVLGVDQNPEAIEQVRHIARELAPHLPAESFRSDRIESMSFPDGCADVVICSAVLHFARDEEQFWAMLHGAWRALAPEGLFFSRLASSIGMEHRVHRIDGRRFALPDGSERFLVDEDMLVDATTRLGGSLVDPLKTTVVQNQRCMTTWVVRKAVSS